MRYHSNKKHKLTRDTKVKFDLKRRSGLSLFAKRFLFVESFQASEFGILTKTFLFSFSGKMDQILGISPLEFQKGNKDLNCPEVGEGAPPTEALLFRGGSVKPISGRSSDLANGGFKPYEEPYLNTQFAIAVTKALASLHALLRARGTKRLQQRKDRSPPPPKKQDLLDQDIWTAQVSRASLVSSNLSIMCSQFEHENVSPRVIRKLDSLQQDISTFAQFLHFASTMQTESRLQSVGPICMCDIWLPTESSEEEGDTLVIRLRGGSHLQAPPLRDVTWIWLTLLQPQLLQDRYIELCESYCSSFNGALKRMDGEKSVQELTLFDVMRDLGDSFLHGFLTIVHKFTVSGVWPLDRRLYTSEGIHAIAESIGFLVDNGIIGSFFVV